MPSNPLRVGLNLKVKSVRRKANPPPAPDLEPIDPTDDDYFVLCWVTNAIAVAVMGIVDLGAIWYSSEVFFNELGFIITTLLIGILILLLIANYLRILFLELLIIGTALLLVNLVYWLSVPALSRAYPASMYWGLVLLCISWFIIVIPLSGFALTKTELVRELADNFKSYSRRNGS